MSVSLNIPENVKIILKILNAAGHEAYIVGGCVRDAILGRTPEDWDITTSAMPEEVKALFVRTIDTGIKHGTVTVLIKGEGYEVTTYRIDGEYEDGRHPKQVTFTRSLSEDLLRRDFTINAMAYHPETGLVDLFGGEEDLKAHIIRAVGVPDDRFDEDALRILRAIRFSAQLDFGIEPATLKSIADHAENLRLISAERIRVELTKTLVSNHPERFMLCHDTGITKVLFPEFDQMLAMPQENPWHCYNVGRHTMEVVKGVPADTILRWAALLHDVGKLWTKTIDEEGKAHFYGHAKKSAEFAGDFLRNLKFDNHTIDMVCLFARHHDAWFDGSDKVTRRVISRVGKENFPALLLIARADAMAKSEYAKTQLLPKYDAVEEGFHRIMAEKQCTSLKELAVNGGDLIKAGIKPGKEMGELLQSLLTHVIEYPEDNVKEVLLERALSSLS